MKCNKRITTNDSTNGKATLILERYSRSEFAKNLHNITNASGVIQQFEFKKWPVIIIIRS